jgi:hypothetical protein
MPNLSVIPAADSVCLTIPATTACRIDFTGEEACNELLKLKADFGEVTEQGILPLVFTHENVIIRAFEERDEIKQHADLFKKACEVAQEQAQDRLQEEVSVLKKNAIEGMLLEITPDEPIVLDDVRASTKVL